MSGKNGPVAGLSADSSPSVLCALSSFSHCTGPWLRFAAYPPCFLNMCTSLFKNTLELGIRRVYERQNAFWGVSNRISGQGQSVV